MTSPFQPKSNLFSPSEKITSPFSWTDISASPGLGWNREPLEMFPQSNGQEVQITPLGNNLMPNMLHHSNGISPKSSTLKEMEAVRNINFEISKD
jgi:hypothetical protein